MSRKKKIAAFAEGKQRERDLKKLQLKSDNELMNEIETYMKRSEEKDFDFDPDYIELRLSILQGRDPMELDFDPNVEIRKLPLNIEAAHGKCGGFGQRRHLWRIVEIAAVFVLLLAIGAGAGKLDLFSLLRQENADTITFHQLPSGEMSWGITSEPDEQEYASLQDALDAHGITTPLCPTWIPADYHIVSVNVTIDGAMSRFVAAYESDERGIISVDFTKFQGGGAKITSEIEPDGEIYEKDGITYYLFPNLEQNKCHWFNDGFMCVINGNLTFDEIKQMVDSIPY